MPVPDQKRGEVVFKIVFAGAEGAGKTASLAAAHRLLGAGCEPAVGAETATDRTIVFGFRPEPPLVLRGLRARFQMLTVPGPVRYAATWQLALRGADGVIFVADSAPERMPANSAALKAALLALRQNGCRLDEVPFVLQLNKRDLPNAVPAASLDSALNVFQPKIPVIESCAETGEGVLAALEALSKPILSRFGAGAASGSAGGSGLPGRAPATGGAPVGVAAAG